MIFFIIVQIVVVITVHITAIIIAIIINNINRIKFFLVISNSRNGSLDKQSFIAYSLCISKLI